MNSDSTEPTYIFENGKVYTHVDNKIVTAANEDEFVEHEASQIAAAESATHIMTPNGLKGKILGRVKGLWDDEVTVRFENGRVASLPVSSLTFARIEDEDEKGEDEIAKLEQIVAKVIEAADASTIGARVKELDVLKSKAASLIGDGLSDSDLLRVGSVLAQANYEYSEIEDRVRAIEEERVAAYEPPAPFKMHVVAQGGPTNGSDAGWLDATLNDMIVEANSTDYEKLMDEGPEAFVAGLHTSMIADAGGVRTAASEWIRSKTAAADDDVRERYEKVWLSRIEDVRRSALAQVKQEMHKQAAASESVNYDNIPDDSIFS
jgi:hypothetical protein